MDQTRLREREDRWELDTQALDVISLSIDNVLRLHLGDDLVLTIEGEAALVRDGHEQLLGTDSAGVLAALSVMWQPVESVRCFKDGRLEVRLGGSAVLRVAADERYEPWNIEARNGARVVSTPGGELAVWMPGESIAIDGRS